MSQIEQSSKSSMARAFVRPTTLDARRDASLLLGLFFLFALIRMAIPTPLLDTFMSYGRTGGSFLEKIHPGAYGVLFLFAIIVLTQAWQPERRSEAVFRASIYLVLTEVVTIALGLLTDRTAAFSYSVDSIIQGPIVAMVILYLDRESQALLFKMTIGFLIINDIVLLFEAITHIRLMPGDFTVVGERAYFRPTAFLGHPLANGLFNAAGLCFAWLLPASPIRRLAISFFFLICCFAATARMAAVLGSLAFLTCTWIYLLDARKRKEIDEGTVAVAAVGSALFLALALAGIVLAGFADRLVTLGLFADESSQTRFKVYDIFSYMSNDELLWGMRRDWQAYLMQNVLDIGNVESSVVAYVTQFGLVGTLLVVPALFYFLYRLATGARNAYLLMGLGTFTACALTNNTFSSKGPALTFITMTALSAQALIAMRQKPRAPASRQLAPRAVRGGVRS